MDGKGGEGHPRAEQEKQVTLIASVQTAWSKRRVLHMLRGVDWNCLFIPLPNDWEDGIRALRQGFGFGEVVREMRDSDIIRLPEDWQIIRSWEPLLKGISYAPQERKIRCYRDRVSFERERQIATDFAILALRAKRGRVKIEEWKELLQEEIHLAEKESKAESTRVIAELGDASACIDTPSELEDLLDARGLRVRKLVADESFLPLDMLRQEIRARKAAGWEIGDDAIAMRIRQHIEFVDMVIGSDTFDDACAKWSSSMKRPN